MSTGKLKELSPPVVFLGLGSWWSKRGSLREPQTFRCQRGLFTFRLVSQYTLWAGHHRAATHKLLAVDTRDREAAKVPFEENVAQRFGTKAAWTAGHLKRGSGRGEAAKQRRRRTDEPVTTRGRLTRELVRIAQERFHGCEACAKNEAFTPLKGVLERCRLSKIRNPPSGWKCPLPRMRTISDVAGCRG
jgi:hypothetical protein